MARDALPNTQVLLDLQDPSGAISSRVETHERAHAKAWQDAYNGVFVPWMNNIAARTKGGEAVEAGTKVLARAKLWKAVGGKPKVILRKTAREKHKNDLAVHSDKARTFTIKEVQPPEPGSQPRVRVVLKTGG